MKKTLFTLLFALGLGMTVSGCSEINVNINLNDTGEAQASGDGSFYEELNEANLFDSIVERNGRLFYEAKNYMKDGSEDEYTIYKDETRYVINDMDGILVIEDGEAYGYDTALEIPYRYLFIDNFDRFTEETEYKTFCIMDDQEEIVSRYTEDGLIYMETTLPGDVAGYFTWFGYTEEEVDSVFEEYVIDEETKEIISLKSYVVNDDEKTLYSEQILDLDCEEYVPDQELIDGIFGEDVRTVTVITDAGTDREKEYVQTITKNGAIQVYAGNDYYKTLYSDPGCVTLIEGVDRTKDLTVYVKRRIDYSDEDNWAYCGVGEEKEADLFLICPTVDMNDEFNMSMEDADTKANFLGALNMERGIYESDTRMYAPYYRQAAMKVYSMTPEEREPYMEYAYDDVSEAFGYYLENENNGRPIILAGFSQGADMCYRLLEEYFYDKEHIDKLVAVYAIGWPCTEALVKEFPQIRPAESADDTGVVISFDCESEDVTDTFITPAGTKAYTINPLSWSTDTEAADRSLNLGACFTDYDGNINSEEKEFCGCYIDGERGILKVTDVNAEDYPALVPGLPDGAYHIYDYQFFYRNLEENVGSRIDSFLNAE
ncbi:MAG: DUF3089 domain-containing protein [Lachnospiraceae bacterium]|nr:DUF3089 domain-containing protein [Lachnospiraceae bacterium]